MKFTIINILMLTFCLNAYAEVNQEGLAKGIRQALVGETKVDGRLEQNANFGFPFVLQYRIGDSNIHDGFLGTQRDYLRISSGLGSHEHEGSPASDYIGSSILIVGQKRNFEKLKYDLLAHGSETQLMQLNHDDLRPGLRLVEYLKTIGVNLHHPKTKWKLLGYVGGGARLEFGRVDGPMDVLFRMGTEFQYEGYFVFVKSREYALSPTSLDYSVEDKVKLRIQLLSLLKAITPLKDEKGLHDLDRSFIKEFYLQVENSVQKLSDGTSIHNTNTGVGIRF